jgi:hypothetical protein
LAAYREELGRAFDCLPAHTIKRVNQSRPFVQKNANLPAATKPFAPVTPAILRSERIERGVPILLMNTRPRGMTRTFCQQAVDREALTNARSIKRVCRCWGGKPREPPLGFPCISQLQHGLALSVGDFIILRTTHPEFLQFRESSLNGRDIAAEKRTMQKPSQRQIAEVEFYTSHHG